MKHFDLKTRLYLVMGLLSTLTLIIWSGFFFQTTNTLKSNTKQYLYQVSNRITERMEDTFLHLEHVSMAMSANKDVKDFLRESDPLVYHQKAQNVSDFLESVYRSDNLVEHILLYNTQGVYRRFLGNIGNTASNRIADLIEQGTVSQHITVTLEGNSYVGYITGIYDHQEPLGYLVFLMPSDRLQQMFQSHGSSNSLQMGLVAKDTFIASNNPKLIGSPVSRSYTKNSISTKRQIGLTPFQILTSDGGQTLRDAQDSFVIAAFVTVSLLIGALVFFYQFLHRRFLHPMFCIIQDAKHIGNNGGSEYLPLTGEEYFDSLVEQINSMVERLQENRQAIYNLDMKRQRTIIVSLKKQINAHFTVNSLNVMKRLNETGQQHKVKEMCDGLSFLLRYVNDGDEFIEGLEEIFILEKYIDIMQIRYPEVFTTEFVVDEKIDSIKLPRMLIQPLLENAILHGLCPSGKKGLLKIKVQINRQAVQFTISDDGVGMSPEKLEKLRQTINRAMITAWDEMGLEHIAIPNIQKRIISLFGYEYGLTLDSKEMEGTVVKVVFPVTYITAQSDETVSVEHHKIL